VPDDIHLDVSELNQLAAHIDSATGSVGARGRTVVEKAAAGIERDAKIFAPVDTGFLRSSIGTDLTGDGRFSAVEAEIGPTAEYGAYVEFGTSRMAPRAYLGPALDRNSPGFVTAVEELGGELL
jgi:HK97 gp10 family phage protein